jgi:hypothetical protein
VVRAAQFLLLTMRSPAIRLPALIDGAHFSMHDEEIKIGDVEDSEHKRRLQTIWACKSCGCGECSATKAPQSVAIQLAKAIVEEHHRLYHSLRKVAPNVHKLS